MLAKYLSIMCSIIYQSTWIWIFFHFHHCVFISLLQIQSNMARSNWNWENWKIVKIFILHKLRNWNVIPRLHGVFTPHFMLMELFPINILHIAYVTFIVYHNFRSCMVQFIWKFQIEMHFSEQHFRKCSLSSLHILDLKRVTFSILTLHRTQPPRASSWLFYVHRTK